MIRLKFVLGGVLLMVVMAGCHGRRGGGTEEAAPSPTIWETTWVDPQLVITEKMFTLIRSARLDSFVVKRATPVGVGSQSVVWQVTGRNCTATVNLLNSRGTVIRPLLVRQLDPGYYKLTLDFSRIGYEDLPQGEYQLRVESCGETKSTRVVRR
jgi:hypothetical protein